MTNPSEIGGWSYCSWIYNYLCNQCPSPVMLRVRIPLQQGVLDTTLYNKVCQWLAAGQWFSPGTLVSSTNKTDCHDNNNFATTISGVKHPDPSEILTQWSLA